MDYSQLESEYLVKLIRSAICCSEVPKAPNGLDWKRLVDLSKEQQVYSIISTVLDSSSLPNEQLEELKLYNQNELVRILAMKTEKQLIEQELEKRKIKYILLKGSVLKSYYPQEKMRQMSDVDILYDEKKKDEINELMCERGYELFNSHDNSDDFKKAPYYTFEFHRELFFKEAEFYPKFDYVWDNATKDREKEYLYNMSLDDMYVYNICHMYKHFSRSCCGIRFLVDNYLFLKKESSKLNWKYIESRFKEYGILDYEKSARLLAFSLFENERLTKEEERLLYLYTNFGVYGNGLGHAVQEYESLNEAGDKKLTYVKGRMFPSKEFLLPNYPFLKKMPFLLPSVYVFRIFKGIFNKKGISELESINNLEDKS